MTPLFSTTTQQPQTLVRDQPTLFQDVVRATEAQLPAVQQKATRLVTDAEIDRLGTKVAGHASKTASQIMANVRASDVDGFGEKLNELVAVSKQLDPKKMGKKGIISRLSSLFGETKEKLLAQYETVEKRMNTLVSEMDKTVQLQQKRIGDLETMFSDNEKAFFAFGEEIKACELLLEAMRAQLNTFNVASDTFDAQRQQDLMDRIHRVEKKADDFLRAQQLCKLAAPEIRLMQSNARSLVTTFGDIKNTTIPAWQGVFSRYIVSMEQKRAAELATSIQDATDQAFRMQADALRENVTLVAKARERSVVGIDTLEHMQQQLIGAVDDVKRITEEGARARAEAKVKLAEMDKQLIERFAAPQAAQA